MFHQAHLLSQNYHLNTYKWNKCYACQRMKGRYHLNVKIWSHDLVWNSGHCIHIQVISTKQNCNNSWSLWLKKRHKGNLWASSAAVGWLLDNFVTQAFPWQMHPIFKFSKHHISMKVETLCLLMMYKLWVCGMGLLNSLNMAYLASCPLHYTA